MTFEKERLRVIIEAVKRRMKEPEPGNYLDDGYMNLLSMYSQWEEKGQLRGPLYWRDVHEKSFIGGASAVIAMLSEAFGNLDDRGWDVVSEGLADPEGADTMLLRLLGTRGRLSGEDAGGDHDRG